LLYWLDVTDSGFVCCADELDKKATKLLQTANIQGLTLDERHDYNEETLCMRKAGQNTNGRVLYTEYYGITERDCHEEDLRWPTARGTKQAGDNKKWQATALALLAGADSAEDVQSTVTLGEGCSAAVASAVQTTAASVQFQDAADKVRKSLQDEYDSDDDLPVLYNSVQLETMELFDQEMIKLAGQEMSDEAFNDATCKFLDLHEVELDNEAYNSEYYGITERDCQEETLRVLTDNEAYNETTDHHGSSKNSRIAGKEACTSGKKEARADDINKVRVSDVKEAPAVGEKVHALGTTYHLFKIRTLLFGLGSECVC